MKIIPTKTPSLLKFLFPKYTWDFYNTTIKKTIYLTFDDGPIPEVTEFVLDQLNQYNAKATFFCIGENIKKHPTIFKKIIKEDHTIGNHTMNHLKAWKNNTTTYIENISACEEQIYKHTTIKNKLFRPPYGQISTSKLKLAQELGYEILLWDIVAKDWEKSLSPQQCAKNVISNSQSGSILVFHDSIKAYKNLKYALPKVLEYFTNKGYVFDKI
ncbi:polysaccharide deacetylase [Flavobacteriaceae bacterium (ex Bugula neritina AB1)]|nr:polysaccharide deacetylase [Flavobacteriaceae bacterium (ex Bugula neritina AB1)]